MIPYLYRKLRSQGVPHAMAVKMADPSGQSQPKFTLGAFAVPALRSRKPKAVTSTAPPLVATPVTQTLDLGIQGSLSQAWAGAVTKIADELKTKTNSLRADLVDQQVTLAKVQADVSSLRGELEAVQADLQLLQALGQGFVNTLNDLLETLREAGVLSE